MKKEEDKKAMFDFLSKEDVVSVATNSEKGPWISNFYYRATEDFRIYFITVKGTSYDKNTLKDNRVAFTVYCHNPETFLERKSVQGSGIVRKASDNEVSRIMNLFMEHFQEIAKTLSEDLLKKSDNLVF